MKGTVRKDGATWRARVRIRGHRYDSRFQTEELARLWLRKLALDYDLGRIDPALTKPRLTFEKAVEMYAADAKLRLAESTLESYAYRLDANLLPALGELQLSECTPAAIEGFISGRLRGGATPADVNHDRMLLGAVFTYCVNHDLMPGNPVRRTQKLRYSSTRVKRDLSDDEINRAVKVLSRPSRLAFLFAVYTGARASEMCRVEWSHIRKDPPRVTIHSLGADHTKTYKSRTIPIHAVLEAELALAPKTGRFLFAGARAEVHGRDFRGIIDRTTELANLEPYRWHDLRHTFATRLRRAGASLEDVAELLGHSSLQSTLIYAHVDQTRLAGELAKVPAAGGAGGEAPPHPARRPRHRKQARRGR